MSIISFILILVIILFFLRKYFKGAQCKIKHSMKGKVVIITGASAGLGKESALDLVKHGAKVILACRNEEKTKQAMKSLSEEEKKLVKFIHIDLCDFNSILKFNEKIREENIKIDILMNNAGLFSQNFEKSKDNMECYLQGNFVGHVLLTFLLFDMLDKKEARIINLSSLAHLNTDYKDIINIKEMYDIQKSELKYFQNIRGRGTLYGNTKVLMIYFSKFLAKLCEGKYNYIKSAALHPGAVDTEFMRFLNKKNYPYLSVFAKIFLPLTKFIFKTPEDGAQTQLHLCYLPFNELISGGYYSDCKIKKTDDFVNDTERIMESMKLTINEIKKRIPETKIFDICNDLFKNK